MLNMFLSACNVNLLKLSHMFAAYYVHLTTQTKSNLLHLANTKETALDIPFFPFF